MIRPLSAAPRGIAGSPRAHPVAWIRAHPSAADASFAVLLTGIALAFHLLDSEIDPDVVVSRSGGWTVSLAHLAQPAWWTVPLVILSVAPIAWRRTRPIAACVAVTVAQVVSSLVDVFGPEFVGVVVALYSLGAHASGRRRTQTVLAVTGLIAALFAAGMLVDQVTVGVLLSTSILLITAFVLGDNLRRRRTAADALQERLERAERERDLIARERVQAERARIARELHDVVAHSVSAMVIQAGAARRSLAHSTDSAEAALVNIEQAGRDAMNELRGVLGVLRRSESHAVIDGESDRVPPMSAPQPTLADLEHLVAAATDLPITATIENDTGGIGSGTDLTAFRVVQESLTNVRRHAGPVTSVTIEVRRGVDELTIDVCDDGRGPAADSGDPGYGLIGMRERVEAVGGRMNAGSRPGGGWKVSAKLPAPRTRTPDSTYAVSGDRGAV